MSKIYEYESLTKNTNLVRNRCLKCKGNYALVTTINNPCSNDVALGYECIRCKNILEF